MVSYLTEALVDLGHDVTLFASGDSRTSARLVPMSSRALRLDPWIRDTAAPHMMMLETVLSRAHEFDVIHLHLDYLAFPTFSRQDTPYLSTVHGRVEWPEIRTVFAAFDSMPIVAISDSQRAPLPHSNWLATVHNGMPPTLLMPRLASSPRPDPLAAGGDDQDQGYLAFLGGIASNKDPAAAIRIAARCGKRIKLAAKIDAVERDYFQREIEPLVSLPHVEFLGEIDDAQKQALLAGADALLFPIRRAEPFGMVLIEAMACGTPSIAFNLGSVSEIIVDGVSGFIVADEDGAVAAVARLDQLSRTVIRERFEARFTAHRMALNYLDVYRRLV